MDEPIRRIRRLRARRLRNRGSSSITYTQSEPYALNYYLYSMFENKSNNRIIETFDSAIRVFIQLVDMIGLTDRLDAVLKTEVEALEKQGLLTLLKNEPDGMSYFDDSDVIYKYEEDKKIDRKMHRYENVDDILVNLHRILSIEEKPVFSAIINTTVFSNSADCKLSSNLKLTKKIEKAVFDISKTQFLVDQVNLSLDEARFILMMCRLETIEAFRDIIRSADNCDNGFRNRLSEMIGITEKDLRTMLRSDNKIKSFGFLSEDGEYDCSLNECIEEQSIDPYFNDLLKPMDCSNAYELDSFSVSEESAEICLDLLKGKKPVSILFYGKPGSGKTELAKTLGKLSDKKVYIFKNEAENTARNMLGRLVCLLSMERPDSILIVDEADTLLKTLDFSFFGTVPTKTKGTVNKMLENNMDKVIYIINHQHQIDESTLRRFNFSMKFEAMPASMLRSIAKSKLANMEIAESTKSQLLDLFDKYHLTGASVDNIVKAIEGMECKDEKILLGKAQVVMKENSLLLNGKAKMRDTVKAEYDPKVLNTSMSPFKIVDMVHNAAKFAEKNKGTESGIRMLFYGVSGTGKTELARYIAEKLGKQILLKRASDILGMYVGQNEKNIRDAFAEAESSGAILLFDEADSFFYNRNNASRSWERSTVNEFLTQMEEFSGILICTTNLRNIMDPAMQRRFHMMVEFKPMKFDGIKTMTERYFPAWHLSNSQIEELEDLDSVTPGDFGSLASRIRFMNTDDINSDYIMEELKKIQKEKKSQWETENGESEHRIGFTA
ncbi:AAA family ATPase [Treponema sp.]|uniref:AAA family ATPase n=1 Tax=Treponema sp. TaxID=166 RepID=UPI00298E5E92|nr:AAA family ATPase [Treponema sp.]MCQ2240204.1 AAA family ATPase [Treponema sp.]